MANSTTWVGIGWRPSNLTSACRAFPRIQDRSKHIEGKPEPEPSAEPKSEPSAEPKSEPSPEPKSEPSAEPEPEPKSEPEPEPESEPTSEPSSEPVSVPKAEPNPEPTSEPEFEHGTGRSGAKRRSAKSGQISSVTSRNDVTVQTSVTYHVSTKQGEKNKYHYHYHYLKIII